jgi:flavin reductase (DIM6/NTAB) family NADH-FMN oxidoreductase RutF
VRHATGRLPGGDEPAGAAAPAGAGRRAAFLDAMSAAVTGVCVVATDGPRGRFGRTVSAMASVSADPPLLLVSLRRRSPLVAAIRAHGAFGVSVLAADQAAVAERFAGRPRDGGRFCFGGIAHTTGASGAPLIAGAAAHFDCRLAAAHEAGTHTLLIGSVGASARGSAAPLAYTGREYARVLR